MKNRYIIITTAFAAAGIFGSCSKTFLDVKPQGQITEVLALTDPEAAGKLVGGAYNTLYFGGFGPTTVGFLWAISNDVASDDADKGSTPGDFSPLGEIDNFTATPNNFIFNNIWSGHYSGIVAANKAIDVLNKSTIDENTKNRLIGEARFLRGLYYFNLVRFFGGVPKIVTVPLPSEGNSDALNTRVTAAEIYAVIIDDLKFAVDNLPLKGDATTQVGRANKGAAQAYLAKVYLYQPVPDWQKVLDLTNAVITSGKYSLVTDYNFIFREKSVGGQGGNNNSESVFEVQTGINLGENAVSPLFSNGQGARSRGGWNDLGFGFNTPSADLSGYYEPGDTRKNATIIFINPTAVGNSPGTVLWDGFRIPSKDSVENDRYSYKPYHSPTAESPQVSTNKDSKPKNIRLMRYAEVLLMYAEAAAKLGNADGVNKLNQVRSRANLLPTTLTQANVWKERRAELAMEQDRFLDLVRQGNAGTVLRVHGKTFVTGKHELFPIPQAQIDLSGNRLTQNNGY